MKRTTYILLLGVGFLLGCKGEEFLEKDPLDVPDVNNFYQDATQIEQGINGIYNAFYFDGMYKRNIWIAQEVGSDNAYFPGNDAFDNYNLNSRNGEVTNIWRDHYRGIVRALTAIQRIPSSQIDEAAKERAIAEARFLHALFYFNLVRFFGDVPVVKEIPEYENIFDLTRTPVNTVYDEVIIPDLQYAAQKLPATQSAKGRATSGAAKTLLAKVHLTRGNYSEVLPLTSELIASQQYQLVPSYADNFSLDKGENNAESIFEMQYTNQWTFGGQEWQFWAPSVIGGWDVLRVSDDLLNAYYPVDNIVDTRRDAVLIKPGDSIPETAYKHPVNATYLLARKYANLKNTQVFFLNSPLNTKVLRYADVLLMHAEASNLVNGPTADAYNAVNMVRRRAYGRSMDLNTPDPVDFANLGQQQLDDSIFVERRRELALESHRWFDLVRKGKAVPVLSAHRDTKTTNPKTIGETDLLFPVPQSEIDINPQLTQNPGY